MGINMYRLLATLVLAASAPLVARAADDPSWPCYHGPNGNFSAADSGLTLVDDLKDARLLWKSVEPTPPGAAQSPRNRKKCRVGLLTLRRRFGVSRKLPSSSDCRWRWNWT
jgi:hypothetical protein